MRILITGSNGQLGSELQDILKDNTNYECYFLNRKQLPLDQTAIIQDILGTYQPNVIIHTAAYTAVDKAEAEQELANKINYLATEEIAQYCRLNETKLLAISTDYVFDGNSSVALREDATVDPLNVYGLTKWKGEQAILKWYPEAIIIRTSWVYSTYGTNFVKTMLRLMSEQEGISVINDQIGSPTYAYDLAQIIVYIIDSGKWIAGIYHYSNEGQISWYDFAVAIRDIQRLNCQIDAISTSAYPTAAKRPAYSLLDKSKIKNTFGIEISDWRSSLERMLIKLKS
ncbi:dTDP-4-dehydrorhamnose reductase [Sphingobacterium pedocola]|uniref:dTDP-4-dehydrorhamnose reductase n=1 Tax=Sphingobacterium pedocola TaxID=2082722 RepID=A0ABR9TDE5_9SPHI|nr:dTDP-4-dehydrorhamnose reductase [Sphingobacterium pedocola]MBE8722874.1 dTDP-4-dehydrorhamnose reductase [Sphingobacterium pedocola]